MSDQMTWNWENMARRRKAMGERRKADGNSKGLRLRAKTTKVGKSGRRKTRSGESGLAETGISKKPAHGGGLELDSGGRGARGRDEENNWVVGAGHHGVRGSVRRKGAGGTAGKPGIS